MRGNNYFRVFLGDEIVMERVVLAMYREGSVALKDDCGESKIINEVEIIEVNTIERFIQLRDA